MSSFLTFVILLLVSQLADLPETIESLKDVTFLNTLDIRENPLGSPDYLETIFASQTDQTSQTQEMPDDTLLAPNAASQGSATHPHAASLRERLHEEFLVGLPLLTRLDGVDITAEEKVLALNHKSLSSYLPPEV